MQGSGGHEVHPMNLVNLMNPFQNRVPMRKA